MAKTEKSAKPKTTPESGATDVTAFMMATNPMATQAWLDFMNESARFVTERLHQATETQRAMLSCRTPAELMKVQSEFYQDALRQYAEEANRLFNLMSDATRKNLGVTMTKHARSYDDVPL